MLALGRSDGAAAVRQLCHLSSADGKVSTGGSRRGGSDGSQLHGECSRAKQLMAERKHVFWKGIQPQFENSRQ